VEPEDHEALTRQEIEIGDQAVSRALEARPDLSGRRRVTEDAVEAGGPRLDDRGPSAGPETASEPGEVVPRIGDVVIGVRRKTRSTGSGRHESSGRDSIGATFRSPFRAASSTSAETISRSVSTA
jgi:hypothetical protein